MKRSLVFLAVLSVWTSIAIAQTKQNPTLLKRQRENTPTAKSVTGARQHRAISPSPVVTGTAKTGSANQQLSQLEHETGNVVKSPPKTTPKSTVPALKSNDSASSKRGMNFSYQPRKSATAGSRAQSATSNRNGK